MTGRDEAAEAHFVKNGWREPPTATFKAGWDAVLEALSLPETIETAARAAWQHYTGEEAGYWDDLESVRDNWRDEQRAALAAVVVLLGDQKTAGESDGV